MNAMALQPALQYDIISNDDDFMIVFENMPPEGSRFLVAGNSMLLEEPGENMKVRRQLASCSADAMRKIQESEKVLCLAFLRTRQLEREIPVELVPC